MGSDIKEGSKVQRTTGLLQGMACESKDEHCITQKGTQPSQTGSEGFIKTQPYAICCCFFAIGECNLINSNFSNPIKFLTDVRI